MSEAEYDTTDPESIERYARRLKGHTIKDLTEETGSTTSITVRSSKGSFGVALEELYFRIRPGNEEGVPDFKEAGLELKSCPTLWRNERLVAKERLVLCIINYDKLVAEEWTSSAFLRKNGNLLLVFYLHEDDVPTIDLKIMLTGRWTFPTEDLLIIRSDWERIRSKVLAGKAHELSEGDTLYLRACTKDACSRTNRSQPFSTIKAKQRAFSLRQTYVDSIIERIRQKDALIRIDDSVVKDPEELRDRTFEELVLDRFRPYLDRTIGDITTELGISYSRDVKNYNALVTKRILGVKKRIEEFHRAEIVVKSILLDSKGNLKESVSFPAFDYFELAKEVDWETSKIKEMFERRFFFVVYQTTTGGDRILRKVQFWSMPYDDLLEVKRVWQETTERIRQGRYEDLPKIRDSPVSHIRPHGRDAQDKVKAPDGSMVIKRCFWLNAKYVAKQVGADVISDYKQSKLMIDGTDHMVVR